MDCHNLLKLSEMLYFALKIVSWSEWAYEYNFGQMGSELYNGRNFESAYKSLTLMKLLIVILRLYL